MSTISYFGILRCGSTGQTFLYHYKLRYHQCAQLNFKMHYILLNQY